MLKKISALVLIVVAIAAAVLGFALYNANSLIERYKPQLEARAGAALGSRVTIGQIETEVFPVSRLRIGALKIGEGTDKEHGFAMKELLLDLNLGALLRKRLEITKLVLSEPQLTIVKDQSGTRVLGIPERKDRPVKDGAQPEKKEERAAAEEKLAVDLKGFHLDNAQVVFEDRVAGKQYRIAPLDVRAAVRLSGDGVAVEGLTISGTALGKAEFTAAAPAVSFEADRLKIPQLSVKALQSSLKAAVEYDFKTKAGSVKAKGEAFELMNIAGAAHEVTPALQQLGMRGYIRPDVDIQLKAGGGYSGSVNAALWEVQLSAQGNQIRDLALDLTGQVSDARQAVSGNNLRFKLNESPVAGNFNAELKGKEVLLKDLKVEAFGGRVEKTATIKLEAERPFTAGTRITGVDIAAMLAALRPGKPAKISGTLSSFQADLAGQLEGDLQRSLSGRGTIAVDNGVLHDVNLAREVLKEIKDLPFLQGSLMQSLPPEVRTVLDTESTKIRTLTANFAVGGERISTDDLNLKSDIFDLEGAGSFGFDSSADLKATILFHREFVARLVASNKNLQYALDQEGRLVVPLQIKGTLPKVVVVPNLTKMLEVGAKAALQGKLKDKAQKELDKIAPGIDLNKVLRF